MRGFAMPNNHIQTADNGDVGDPQADIPVSQAVQLQHLQKRVKALEEKLADVLSIAAASYALGQQSDQPNDERQIDTPLALRHACQGKGPAVDVTVVAPDGITHHLRVTPGVTNADRAWAIVLRRSRQRRDSA